MNSRQRRASILAITAIATLAVTSCSQGASDTNEGGAGDGNEPQKVRIMTTQAAWTISYSPLIAAEEMGYFQDEGLEVEWLNDSSASSVATQVQQGNVEIGIVSPEPVIIGHAKGGFSAEFYSSMFRHSIFGVAVPEESPIEDASDLGGARVGVTSLASSGAAIAKAIARSGGVEEGGIQLVAIGAGGQAMAALEAGEVDALSLFDTQYQTFENNGIPLRELDREPIKDLTSGGLVALPENVESNSDLYLGAARAIAKGVLFTSLNPEATVEIFWERYPESKSAELSDDEAMEQNLSILNARMKSYDLESESDRWGAFPDDSFEKLVSFMEEFGLIDKAVDPSQVYTEEYVDQINDFDRADVEADAENFGN